MFYDEELFWLNYGNIITNIVTITVIVAEVGLVIWLMLLWLQRNFNWSPAFHIGELSSKRSDGSPIETEKKVKKDLGPVEVDIKKHINISEADISDLKTDEEVKGKVKTQKDKLRSLRR